MQYSDPLGFLLTWSTHGTWLHGDLRQSVSKRETVFTWPKLESDPAMLRHMKLKLKQDPFLLELEARRIADQTIREVCTHRGWQVPALNVRTNHVHVVCCGRTTPEKMLGDLKAWSTRRLREAGLVSQNRRIWTDGGSTRYLWERKSFDAAVYYVLHEQGEDLLNG